MSPLEYILVGIVLVLSLFLVLPFLFRPKYSVVMRLGSLSRTNELVLFAGLVMTLSACSSAINNSKVKSGLNKIESNAESQSTMKYYADWPKIKSIIPKDCSGQVQPDTLI